MEILINYRTVLMAVIIFNGVATKPDENCPASFPCTCSGTSIYCYGSNLTDIPPFQLKEGLWSLNLFSNNIKCIPSNAFQNLTLQSLQINDNQIASISDDAFTGSENSLNVVYLNDNKLTTFPSAALGKLKNLTELYIFRNPIPELPDAALKPLSASLTSLAFGSQQMLSWPTSLSNLSALWLLDVYDLQLKTFPDDLFRGFEETLVFLSFQYCAIEEIPTSLNRLKNLQYFALEGNSNLSSEGIRSIAFNGLDKLLQLTISHCAIESLPIIFHYLPNLTTLHLRAIPLSNLSKETFTNASRNFSYISFNDTLLTYVPEAFSKLSTVNRLELMNSNIENIRTTDFSGMTSLETLYLSHNPISTMEDEAFSQNSELKYMSLDITNLASIPKALANLKNLTFVNFLGSNIICSCESLGWIKHWENKPANLQLLGYCHNNGMDFMKYISKDVTKCP